MCSPFPAAQNEHAQRRLGVSDADDAYQLEALQTDVWTRNVTGASRKERALHDIYETDQIHKFTGTKICAC